MGINIINYALAKKTSETVVIDYERIQNTPIIQIGSEGSITEISSLESGLYRVIGDYSIGGEVIEDENNNSLIQISNENQSIIINDPDVGIKKYLYDGGIWIRDDVDHQAEPVDEQAIIDLFKK